MAWHPVTALVCVPSSSGEPSTLCPEGHALSTQVVYVPTHDPSLPTPQHWEFTVLSFSFVMTVWILSKVLGRIISFVQRV